MNVIFDGTTKLSEEIVNSLVHKFIYVPENEQISQNSDGSIEEVNAWFGGYVYGYEKALLYYDYSTEECYEEPRLFFNLLLSDGLGYILSPKKCVIQELTEEEYKDRVREFEAKLIMEDKAEGEFV